MPHYKETDSELEKIISPSGFENQKPLTAKEAARTFRLHHVSVKNAWNGVTTAFLTQPNFRIHVVFFIGITVLSYLFQISLFEYISIVVVSALVIVCEMVNTAVEAVSDEVAQGEYRRLIGVAKDVAAGAVLISAMFAILVAALIFGPRILDILQS
jgi:diacylglycerol kinase (ATP)